MPLSALKRSQPVPLSPVVWGWFPPLLALIVVSAKALSPAVYQRFIFGEQGLTEQLTALIGLLAVYLGVRVLLLARQQLPILEVLWLGVATLGCVYLAGEEVSWGQQLVHWQTSETFAALNHQRESNLHNMSSWLNQKPRILLELWVLVGGIALPVWRSLTNKPLRPVAGFAYWFWPGRECLPTALLAIFILFPKRYRQLFELPGLLVEVHWSELQEYYFALFLALYLAVILRRLQGAPSVVAGR